MGGANKVGGIALTSPQSPTHITPMRKTLFTLALAFALPVGLLGCESDVEDAQEDVMDAQEDVMDAREDVQEEMDDVQEEQMDLMEEQMEEDAEALDDAAEEVGEVGG